MKYNLYWGDMHTNIHGKHIADIEETYGTARDMLDFFPVAYYPFFYYDTKEGLAIESCGQREEFLEDWKKLQQMVAEYNEPRRFVTFIGYEWHGDRRRYGDHNVFYFDENNPLDDAESIEELYDHLRQRKGMAIPHHTGYQVGERGKDWDFYDEDISPFAEIYSAHGSSEGCNTPFPLITNGSMGPRVSGGTVQDGLHRGYRLGIIASGDNHNRFPGVWGNGLAGVYAEELTREAIWDAFMNRRVCGVTGDRIAIDFNINDHFVGEVFESDGPLEVKGQVIGSQAIDRIELIRNNRVIHTWCHAGDWEVPQSGPVRIKVKVEFGWGPAARYGLKVGDRKWTGGIQVRDGKIISAEGCFAWFGQKIERVSETQCNWRLTTRQRSGAASGATQQSIIFEVEARPQSEMVLDVDGKKTSFTVASAVEKTTCIAMIDEAEQLIAEQFSLSRDDIENPDVFWHNAYKVKIHKAIPSEGYTALFQLTDDDPPSGRNFYYLRASQLNGQMAWTSPIWVQVC